jgi:hypothetical protein
MTRRQRLFMPSGGKNKRGRKHDASFLLLINDRSHESKNITTLYVAWTIILAGYLIHCTKKLVFYPDLVRLLHMDEVVSFR